MGAAAARTPSHAKLACGWRTFGKRRLVQPPARRPARPRSRSKGSRESRRASATDTPRRRGFRPRRLGEGRKGQGEQQAVGTVVVAVVNRRMSADGSSGSGTAGRRAASRRDRSRARRRSTASRTTSRSPRARSAARRRAPASALAGGKRQAQGRRQAQRRAGAERSRALRRDPPWSTTPGHATTAHNAIATPATGTSVVGSRRTITRATPIAAIAVEKLRKTSARPESRAEPGSADVVELARARFACTSAAIRELPPPRRAPRPRPPPSEDAGASR